MRWKEEAPKLLETDNKRERKPSVGGDADNGNNALKRQPSLSPPSQAPASQANIPAVTQAQASPQSQSQGAAATATRTTATAAGGGGGGGGGSGPVAAVGAATSSLSSQPIEDADASEGESYYSDDEEEDDDGNQEVQSMQRAASAASVKEDQEAGGDDDDGDSDVNAAVLPLAPRPGRQYDISCGLSLDLDGAVHPLHRGSQRYHPGCVPTIAASGGRVRSVRPTLKF